MAILGEPGFDTTLIDPATVRLSGAPIASDGRHNKLKVKFKDVNRDGETDLLAHFENSFTTLGDGPGDDDRLLLWGSMTDGLTFGGADHVTVVPSKKKKGQ